jgi:putative pyruvate formate lyase activating enzyme
VSFERLAKMMLDLQSLGCHNINLVTPSHFAAQILKALPSAIEAGLRIPLVYNSGGYDAVETLRLLEGAVDIYMPDFKFGTSEPASFWCTAADYPDKARSAVREMHRQVGDLVVDKDGIAQRGLIVRHLVLPQGQAGSREVLRFIATEISKSTYVNLMDQFYPCGGLAPGSPLARRITREEFAAALEIAQEEGLTRLDRGSRPHDQRP